MKAIALLLAVTLGGCGVNLSRPAPQKQSFLLQATRPAAATTSQSARHAHILRINRFDVAQPFNGRPLVYRTAEGRFETDFYNEFVATPAGMLTERTAGWLREARAFRHVIPMTSSLEHRFVLEATGVEMYGDFGDAEPAAVLSIRFFLARNDANSAIVYDRTHARRVPIASRSPALVARGLDQALAAILAAFETDLLALTLSGAD